jgi:hypothetical protein
MISQLVVEIGEIERVPMIATSYVHLNTAPCLPPTRSIGGVDIDPIPA